MAERKKRLYVNMCFLDSIKDDHSKITAYALYLKFKKRFRNGLIYKYNPEILSKLFNVSSYHVRKSIPILIKMELIEKCQNGTLILKSFKYQKLGEKIQKPIDVHFTDSLNHVVIKLRYALLRTHLIDKQRYIQSAYNNFANVKISREDFIPFKKQLNKLRRLGYKFSEKLDVNVCAGYKKMAQITGMNKSEIKKFLIKLTDWEYFKYFKQDVIQLFSASYTTFIKSKKYDLNRGYCFYKAGYVFCHKGTILIF